MDDDAGQEKEEDEEEEGEEENYSGGNADVQLRCKLEASSTSDPSSTKWFCPDPALWCSSPSRGLFASDSDETACWVPDLVATTATAPAAPATARTLWIAPRL